MANKLQEEVKQKAIAELAASRAEIAAELRRIRMNLSPKRVAHRVMEQHKGAVAGIAIAAGVGCSLLILRKMGSARREQPRHAMQPAPRLGITSQIMRVVAGSLIPALLKSAVSSPSLASLVLGKARPSGGSRPH